LSIKKHKKSQDKATEKEFENLLNDCKKNKISQALLLMNHALYLNGKSSSSNDPEKIEQEQKTLVEVSFL
jgi:hypothetical protein